MIPGIILEVIGDWNQIVCVFSDYNTAAGAAAATMGRYSNCILNVVAFGDANLLALELIGAVIFFALAFGLPASIMLPISTILFYALWATTGSNLNSPMLVGFGLSLVATALIWGYALWKGGG